MSNCQISNYKLLLTVVKGVKFIHCQQILSQNFILLDFFIFVVNLGRGYVS